MSVHSQSMQGSAGSEHCRRGVLVRLGVMMLLEFVVFGSWFATVGLVLQSHGLGEYIGTTYFFSALAAMVSPLFLGALGDRYIEAQKVMAIAHLVGGAVLWLLPGALAGRSIVLFLGLVFVYLLFFMPTLGLVNSIALRHLGASKANFAYIRVAAPLGWVIAGVGVGMSGLSASPAIFSVAAVASAMLGLYSLTLPRTPPPERGKRLTPGDLIGIKAFVLFRNPAFTVLILCSLITAISLGIYNAFTASYLAVLGVSNVAGFLALGQASEIVLIATIPFFLARIGMKWTLMLGIAMWAVRFALFIGAAHSTPLAAAVGVALHGMCNDFCMVIAAMYIDRLAPPQLAAQAQSWLILVFSGVGAAIGSALAGALYAHFVVPNVALGAVAWTPLWMAPIAVVMVNLLLWVFLFKEHESDGARGAAKSH